MKEMKYSEKRKFEILDSGKIEGYEYAIMSYGMYPCAYVGIPQGHKFYKKDYDKIEEMPCHCGLTYSEMGIRGLMMNLWVIGWDYAHCSDRCGDFGQGKEWTTSEILEEVKSVISQLKKGEENNG